MGKEEVDKISCYTVLSNVQVVNQSSDSTYSKVQLFDQMLEVAKRDEAGPEREGG